jgi:hypothetical protein
MSLWHPHDIVTDEDLAVYEPTVLTQHGTSEWPALRTRALTWIFNALEQRGFAPERFRTRAVPTAAYSYNGSAYTDQTSALQTTDGFNLASLLSTSSKYLYIGSDTPFRGLSIRVYDSPNSAAVTLTASVWADTWDTMTLTDSTAIGTTPLAKGGSILWTPPEAFIGRSVNSSDSMYWVRLSCSAAPTGCTAGPISVIRQSRLTEAVTFRTLMHIFRAAEAASEGPWKDKAAWYEREAEQAWLAVADSIGSEFDTDGDDAIDGDEETQTADEVSGGSCG